MTSNSGLPSFYAATRQGEAPRDLKPEQPSFFNRLFGYETVENSAGMVAQKGYGNNKDGSTIDTQTDLLWGAPDTARVKGVKQLFPRPFATTPNLSLGSIENIPDQSKVIFGHSTANRKSIQTVTDKQFPVFEPLLPEKEADIAENNYFVEPFLRGGLSSRLIPRIRVDVTK